MKKIIKFVTNVLIFLILLSGLYVSDFYRPSDRALEVLDSRKIRIIEDNDYIIFVPDKIEAGLIFYPGAKVEFRSYSELMRDISENNILCVIASMPLNIASFGVDKADRILRRYYDIDRWYMAGHSLGGSYAARYIAEHKSKFEGLILMGSYIDVDLSDSGLKVMSFLGTEDGILNKERYKNHEHNLPKDYIKVDIEGGNHSQYGDYGLQKGDNEAKISFSEQRRIVVTNVVNMIKAEQ